MQIIVLVLWFALPVRFVREVICVDVRTKEGHVATERRCVRVFKVAAKASCTRSSYGERLYVFGC